MPKNPWFKFYPADWRADQTLRLCSAAARGLWVECMCLMHEATPYGHLLVNGRPVTDTQLANLTGIPQDQISALIAELENSGVFSRNSDGVIYSRRMTRDAKRAADGQRYGRRGGNPALTHNHTDKPTLKGHANPEVHPEARGHIPDKQKDPGKIVQEIGRSLSGSGPQWTPEQKRAAWQSKICNEARRIMRDEDYARFLAAWADNEPQAKKTAERIDASLKAAQARA